MTSACETRDFFYPKYDYPTDNLCCACNKPCFPETQIISCDGNNHIPLPEPLLFHTTCGKTSCVERTQEIVKQFYYMVVSGEVDTSAEGGMVQTLPLPKALSYGTEGVIVRRSSGIDEGGWTVGGAPFVKPGHTKWCIRVTKNWSSKTIHWAEFAELNPELMERLVPDEEWCTPEICEFLRERAGV